jgi:hypothetical protein
VQPWEQAYLKNLRRCYSVTEAAESRGDEKKGLLPVDRSRRTINKWRSISKRFDRLCREAEEAITDSLEASVLEKAINGWLEPVYYQGQIRGAKPVFSPGLMIWTLRNRRPDKWGLDRGDRDSSDAQEFARKVRDALSAIDAGLQAEQDQPPAIDVASSPAPQPGEAPLP